MSAASRVPRVSVERARALLEQGYSYLDVRTEAEYAAGHPPGAANIPFELMGVRGSLPNPDFITVLEAVFDHGAPLVVGCQRGQRSLRAAAAMSARGYQRLVELRPGFDGLRDPFGQILEPGWWRAGQPVELLSPGLSYPELRRQAEAP